jgi:hypothetical protein
MPDRTLIRALLLLAFHLTRCLLVAVALLPLIGFIWVLGLFFEFPPEDEARCS